MPGMEAFLVVAARLVAACMHVIAVENNHAFSDFRYSVDRATPNPRRYLADGAVSELSTCRASVPEVNKLAVLLQNLAGCGRHQRSFSSNALRSLSLFHSDGSPSFISTGPPDRDGKLRHRSRHGLRQSRYLIPAFIGVLQSAWFWTDGKLSQTGVSQIVAFPGVHIKLRFEIRPHILHDPFSTWKYSPGRKTLLGMNPALSL